MGVQKQQKFGFTIVELLVVIVVLGILASVGVVGYGAWKSRTAQNAIKSDLTNVVAAMESARNFGSGYPAIIPTTVSASKDVTLFGGSFNAGQAFCVQGTSTQSSGTVMYVTNTNKTPQSGNCSATTGLVAAWVMNGNATDASGNNNNGTVSGTAGGVSLASDKYGAANKAYNFSSTGYIDGGTSTSLTFTNNFTLAAWIYPTAYHSPGYFGLMNGIVARGPAATFNYVLQAKDSTTITFVKRTGSEGLQFYHFTVPDLTAKWTHVALTISSGTPPLTATLYINGVQQAVNSSVTAIAGVANDRLYIGSTGSSAANVDCFFIGSIDDVRIYNRALPAADIAALAASAQ